MKSLCWTRPASAASTSAGRIDGEWPRRTSQSCSSRRRSRPSRTRFAASSASAQAETKVVAYGNPAPLDEELVDPGSGDEVQCAVDEERGDQCDRRGRQRRHLPRRRGTASADRERAGEPGCIGRCGVRCGGLGHRSRSPGLPGRAQRRAATRATALDGPIRLEVEFAGTTMRTAARHPSPPRVGLPVVLRPAARRTRSAPAHGRSRRLLARRDRCRRC